MTIHDFTRLHDGEFHAFHHAWIGAIQQRMNSGLLPEDYYALAEQYAGPTKPDVLMLERREPFDGSRPGGTALAEAKPKVKTIARSDRAFTLQKRKTVVIRHISGDRIVAMIEIASPGNKMNRAAFDQLVKKTVSSVGVGHHVLLIDLIPSHPSVPNGLHGAIWADLMGDPFEQPADEPLTLVSYQSDEGVGTAYLETTAVGQPLIDMPVFLDDNVYVNVPLADTYAVAFNGMPPHLRRRLSE